MSPSWVETPYVNLFAHHLAFTGSLTHLFPFSHLRHQQYSLISLFFFQIFPCLRGFTVRGSVCQGLTHFQPPFNLLSCYRCRTAYKPNFPDSIEIRGWEFIQFSQDDEPTQKTWKQMEAWGASVAQQHMESSGEQVMESFGSSGVAVTERSGLYLQNRGGRVVGSEGSGAPSKQFCFMCPSLLAPECKLPHYFLIEKISL